MTDPLAGFSLGILGSGEYFNHLSTVVSLETVIVFTTDLRCVGETAAAALPMLSRTSA